MAVWSTISPRRRKNFCPLLTSAEKQLYAALVQHNLDIQSLSCEESFIDGFRLGARLILEIFSEADGCLRALV